jgi:hypothetical protein
VLGPGLSARGSGSLLSLDWTRNRFLELSEAAVQSFSILLSGRLARQRLQARCRCCQGLRKPMLGNLCSNVHNVHDAHHAGGHPSRTLNPRLVESSCVTYSKNGLLLSNHKIQPRLVRPYWFCDLASGANLTVAHLLQIVREL